MLIALALITTGFSLYYVVMPVVHYNRCIARREWEDEYRLVKLRAIKKYYTSMSLLTYREIEENFDVDSAYDNIGRKF